jgi:hypothetical protein
MMVAHGTTTSSSSSALPTHTQEQQEKHYLVSGLESSADSWYLIVTALQHHRCDIDDAIGVVVMLDNDG